MNGLQHGPNYANDLPSGDVLPPHEQLNKGASATTLNNGYPTNAPGNNGLADEKGVLVEEGSKADIAALKAETLEPTLGVWSGSGLIIGLMIGSG